MNSRVIHADSRQVLAEMAPESVDAVVCDPPYELAFMGRRWDATGIAFDPEFWDAVLRALKPGGHLLAFGGSRTYHRMACAIEDAGFEIRDSIHWTYLSGFPKSLDITKAIDAIDKIGPMEDRARAFTAWMRSTGITAQQINDATDSYMGSHYLTDKTQPSVATADLFDRLRPLLPPVPEEIEELVRSRTVERENMKRREVVGHISGTQLTFAPGQGKETEAKNIDITAPATDAARTWSGWGTALKPSHEPIVMARRPLVGTVAGNVLRWGTGGVNVDGCRVATGKELRRAVGVWQTEYVGGEQRPINTFDLHPDGIPGRWPPNTLLSHGWDCGEQCAAGCPVAELDRQSGTLTSGTREAYHQRNAPKFDTRRVFGEFHEEGERQRFAGDSGGASRMFPCFEFDHERTEPFRYFAKPSRAEREAGCDHLPAVSGAVAVDREEGSPGAQSPRAGAGRVAEEIRNVHPTVKSIALMRWLCRLVTPPGGTVLDPFLGSGTTGCAAALERFDFIGIEREAEYVAIAEARIAYWARQSPITEKPTKADGPLPGQLGLFG